ncbi:major facilitator superfamily transporter [Phlyctema vagabunda]|uniref:Major facilitator superfamily transporter n=1 Tax=Phlyctema vagabunda TaxID=108571 RepID=A0ABR4PA26_9HELO
MSVPSADTSSATAVEADQAHQSGILGVSVEPLEMSQGTSPEDITFPTGTKLGVILLALGLSLILTGLDGSILATAIPTITTEFKTTADTGWYVAGFRLTSISFQFIFVCCLFKPLHGAYALQGKMYQMYSIKTIFMITCAIFELGSLLCATAPTSHAFILGRAVCGLGTCGIIQGVFTIAGQSVPVRQRALYGGMGSGVEAIASVSAPLLGGIITESIGWRWCFYINLPLGAISIGIIALYFKDPQINPSLSLPFKEKLARLDLFGTMIFIPSITTCLLALQYGGSKYEWNDPRMIILFVAFSVGLGIFIWMQYRQQDRGTIPPRIILQRSVISGFIFSCSNNAALNIVGMFKYLMLLSPRDTICHLKSYQSFFAPMHSGVLYLQLLLI